MLAVPEVFLRRPLSIYAAAGKTVEFLYRIVGRGTDALSRMKPGATVAVMGPLGAGYDLAPAVAGALPLLVAGGTGIASVHFLAERLPKPGILFYGARSAGDCVPVADFRRKGWKIVYTTEDGSRGRKGLVTAPIIDYLARHAGKPGVLYACGPHGMLKGAAALAAEAGIPAYVSLEEMMACGLGNCQGCAVTVRGEHKMVCKDGPVFKAGDVDWK